MEKHASASWMKSIHRIGRATLTILIVATGIALYYQIKEEHQHQVAFREKAKANQTFEVMNSPTGHLSKDEVLLKFRERASATELEEFAGLAKLPDSNSQDRAREIVLFKLTTDELLQVGVGQREWEGRYIWNLAVAWSPRPGTLELAEKAFRGVGVTPGAMTDLGAVSWSVSRDKFFTARRALIEAGLFTNRVKIFEPQFQLN